VNFPGDDHRSSSRFGKGAGSRFMDRLPSQPFRVTAAAALPRAGWPPLTGAGVATAPPNWEFMNWRDNSDPLARHGVAES
jgi:hypothetical protein